MVPFTNMSAIRAILYIYLHVKPSKVWGQRQITIKSAEVLWGFILLNPIFVCIDLSWITGRLRPSGCAQDTQFFFFSASSMRDLFFPMIQWGFRFFPFLQRNKVGVFVEISLNNSANDNVRQSPTPSPEEVVPRVYGFPVLFVSVRCGTHTCDSFWKSILRFILGLRIRQ